MFTKIHNEIWASLKKKDVSQTGKLLFIYLFSCEHRNIIGLYKLPTEYMAADTGIPLRKVIQTVSELYEKGLMVYDSDTEMVLLNGFLEHNPLQNPKMEAGAAKVFKELPKTRLISDFLNILEHLPIQYRYLMDTVSEQYGGRYIDI